MFGYGAQPCNPGVRPQPQETRVGDVCLSVPTNNARGEGWGRGGRERCRHNKERERAREEVRKKKGGGSR